MKEPKTQILSPNIDELKKLIYSLQKRIEDLEQRQCDCCTTDPLISTIEGHILEAFENDGGYDFEAVLQFTNPNDRFQVPTCGGRKGIIFLDDATVYYQYHDQDGWIVLNVSKSINFIN